ncbi:GNAT family N-acetyltransferase [Thermomonospora umbrina]|uniref:Ribosomal protein S18 acetylase RimI-like enzyme n=1 Tax=Thermomonospora umbrina TaxID=111806 RepID=A0A3D9ST11_9ACTN|nr:GNAT family N-acetyltransferase [Thermomonospora umbrina]REE95704.1 ribosomal protein S18 acetylase RimI-like enzyme [Thermomonospora umbrina]
MTALDTLTRHGHEPPCWRYRDLVIRRYVPADHATVLELHRSGLARVGLRPGDGVYYEHDLFRIEEIYLRRGGEFVVGERAGEVVALGGLRRADLIPCGVTRAEGVPGVDEDAWMMRPPTTGTAEMVRLRVRPDLQRRGYGSAIVRALELRAAELGYRTLHCDTTDLQVPAMELYRGFDWRETRREVIGGIVNVYFEKALT